MKQRTLSIHPFLGIALAFIFLGNSKRVAHAAILEIEAEVSASIQEFLNGEPASRSEDEAAKKADDPFPVISSAELFSTDLGGAVTGLAQGFSIVANPARLDEPNPQDFALEGAAFSSSAEPSYQVRISARQSRRVVYASPGNPDDLPVEIEFQTDGARTIRSSVFLSGAILLWSDSTADESTFAEVNIHVERAGNELWRGSLRVGGGDVDSEAVVVEAVSVEALAEFGVDEASAAVLAELADRGSLQILLIPPQEHQYRYRVRADQEFTLGASFEMELRNASSGSGVAVVLGRPFEDLAAFVERAIPGVQGEILQAKLNQMLLERELEVFEPEEEATSAGPALCGSMGLAALAFMGLPLVRLHRNRRTRRFMGPAPRISGSVRFRGGGNPGKPSSGALVAREKHETGGE